MLECWSAGEANGRRARRFPSFYPPLFYLFRESAAKSLPPSAPSRPLNPISFPFTAPIRPPNAISFPFTAPTRPPNAIFRPITSSFGRNFPNRRSELGTRRSLLRRKTSSVSRSSPRMGGWTAPFNSRAGSTKILSFGCGFYITPGGWRFAVNFIQITSMNSVRRFSRRCGFLHAWLVS